MLILVILDQVKRAPADTLHILIARRIIDILRRLEELTLHGLRETTRLKVDVRDDVGGRVLGRQTVPCRRVADLQVVRVGDVAPAVRAGALRGVGREAKRGRVAGVELEGSARLGVFGGRAGEDEGAVAPDACVGGERGREEARAVEVVGVGVLHSYC